MSDQSFKGLCPKSATGRSIYFYSLDLWIELHNCLVMLIDEAFPSYPSIDAESAEVVADMLERRLSFGLVRAYYELAVQPCSNGNTSPSKQRRLSQEDHDYVSAMVDLTAQFAAFLRDSGGCEAE